MSSPEVHIDRIGCQALHIPFTTTFRHASAERSATETLWVEVVASDGVIGIGECCPRSYVTGETLRSAWSFVENHAPDLAREITSIDALTSWMSGHAAEIDRNPAAWCGVETAILDLLGKSGGAPVEHVLALPPLSGNFRYSAIIGSAEPPAFHTMVDRYWQQGFRDFKVKLSGDRQRDRMNVDAFRRYPQDDVRVRADANNLWREPREAIDALVALEFPLAAIEEPLGPAAHRQLPAVASALGCPIVLDESLVRVEQLDLLTEPPPQWIVNIRVSKMGGIIRSLAVLDAVRRRGIAVIVGAQVGETSLLTRAGLTVAHAAGQSLMAQEGAFGTHLLERDVCDPPLMFGKGGVLRTSDHPMVALPGFGIRV